MKHIYVGETKDIKPGSMKKVDVADRVPLCIINCEGRYYAISGVCAHKGGPLWEGELIDGGKYIKCPYHDAIFRTSDGRNGWPAPRPLRTFPLEVEGAAIYMVVPD